MTRVKFYDDSKYWEKTRIQYDFLSFISKKHVFMNFCLAEQFSHPSHVDPGTINDNFFGQF